MLCTHSQDLAAHHLTRVRIPLPLLAKEPIRLAPEPRSYDPVELLEIPFELPDDFISAATHMANLSQVSVYLLTLMVSDGQPKPNGRESTYIPRGFLTLECVEAENGCPYAIKAREESDGWYLRPWREKGKGDLKGAVSTLHCKHGKLHPHASPVHEALD